MATIRFGRKLAFLIGLSLVGWYYYFISFSLHKTILSRTNMSSILHTNECDHPVLDPFDPSVLEFIQKQKPLKCSKQYSLSYISNDWLFLNKTVQQDYYDGNVDYCLITEIVISSSQRGEGYKYEREIIMNSSSIQLEFPLIRITCFYNSKEIYLNFHTIAVHNVFLDQTRRTIFLEQKSSPTNISVVMIGIDSLSFLSYQRHMPKTRQLLQSLGVIELTEHHKIGLNTFPNLIALLTGNFYTSRKEFNADGPYDNMTSLFSILKDNGYFTLYSEDCIQMSTFNYLSKGFTKPPTDYYMSPLLFANKKSRKFWKKMTDCFVLTSPEFHLNYLEQFLTSVGSKPHFSLTFSVCTTHDDSNGASKMDDIFYDFYIKLIQNELLNNTVLIFFSDHGIRFGKLRNTFLGFLEDRRPMASILLPSWFKSEYSDLYGNLIDNKDRLSSHFDLHQTIRHFIKLSLNIKNEEKLGDRGQSLLKVLPPKRSCKDCSIPDEYCTCYQVKPTLIGDYLANFMAEKIIKKINSHTESHKMCSKLRLNFIKDIIALSNRDDDKINLYSITIVLKPGNATFQTLYGFSPEHPQGHGMGEIQRLDKYQKYATCIKSHFHERFCICKQ